MPRANPASIFFLLIACPPLVAQVDATYEPYGVGCPGTGAGLGSCNVVPATMATSFGGSDNSIPFTWSPVKYQQVFLGSDLPRAFAMGGLAVRQNERGVVAHGVTVDLEIQVGYTTRTPSTMSTTFAANFDSGAPVLVLPRAQVVFPDQSATPPTSPSQFLFTIPWPVRFDWVPLVGRNFLVQVTVHGNSNNNRIWGYPLDACGCQTARLYGEPAAATTGRLEPGYGLALCLREWTSTAVPVLDSKETPQIGNQFPVRLAQARARSAALLFLGASRTAWGALPLPFDLGLLGAPGCSLLASGEILQAVATSSSGTASVTYDIPNDLYLLRLRFYNQFLVADPANGLGIVLSNGGAALVGNQ